MLRAIDQFARSTDGAAPSTDLLFAQASIDRAALSTDVLWGFATAADKQRVEAFIRRGVRFGLYLSLIHI